MKDYGRSKLISAFVDVYKKDPTLIKKLLDVYNGAEFNMDKDMKDIARLVSMGEWKKKK